MDGRGGERDDMSLGVWFALCAVERCLAIEALAAEVATLKGRVVRVERGQLHVEVAGAEIIVSAQVDAGVLAEAAEIADRHGRPEVAGCGARYELTWELDDSDAVYNTLVAIASRLEKRCEAAIYDATGGRFV